MQGNLVYTYWITGTMPLRLTWNQVSYGHGSFPWRTSNFPVPDINGVIFVWCFQNEKIIDVQHDQNDIKNNIVLKEIGVEKGTISPRGLVMSILIKDFLFLLIFFFVFIIFYSKIKKGFILT